ncbi:MAG: hypothetical protein WBI14_07745 [Anaerolineaceae bacterium]
MLSDPLIPNDPISLIFAADLSSQVDQPVVDAVWQLSLNPQKPLQIETNLGLKVRSLIIYPSFQIDNRQVSQISTFFSKPIIESWLPDYYAITFRPQIGLFVRYEVWARTSQDVLGLITLTNERTELAEFGVQLVGEFLSLSGSGAFVPTKYKYQSFLKGSGGQFDIALWLDRPARPVLSPIPALGWNKAFIAGESASVYWQCSVLEATQKSFNKISHDFPDNWEALIAYRQSSVQAELLEVETGNSEIDLAIRSSQYLATQLRIEEVGFTKTRNPSLNASSKSTTLPDIADVWFLVMANLTTNPLFAASLLTQTIQDLYVAQIEKGEQSQGPFPILARMVWKVFQRTQDRLWVSSSLDRLFSLNMNWFSQANDADQDGLPEWGSLYQTKFLSNFGFSLFESEKLPGDIRMAENFALGVLLKSELTSLIKLANLLEKPDEAHAAQECLSRLDLALKAWVRETPQLSWRDAISHDSSTCQRLFKDPHQAARKLNLTLSTPARLHLQLRPSLQMHRPSMITIQGRDQHDQAIESHIQTSQIIWLPGLFYAKSDHVFKTVESVSVEGLDFAELTLYTTSLPSDDISELFVGFEDIADGEGDHRIANWLALHDQTAFGFPERLGTSEEPESKQVNLFWHSLLLEELIESGQKKTAHALLERLLSAHARILSTEHALFSAFTAADAKPAGTRNSVESLIPIEQILEIAGVKIHHARKVSLGGENGFTQPITFRYRGLEVTRDGKNGHVRMPDGTEFHHFGSTTKTFQIE